MTTKVSIKNHIPNLITSLNLLTGCISISLSFHGALLPASILIFVAGIFDFFDGLAARALHAYSEIGKMLDSLADVVSFGVAPSVILFHLLGSAVLAEFPVPVGQGSGWYVQAIPYTAFLVAIFSALRLAKFNIDERQATSFIGIPTPANAFFIASIPFILRNNEGLQTMLLNVYVLIPLIVVLSALLVAEIPMISLKFKNLSYSDNKSRYLLLILSLILLLFLRVSAIPAIFLLYIIISLVDNPQKTKH